MPIVSQPVEFALSGNSAENHPLHWEPNPDRRGTINILLTCLTTLSLCAWTVLHLDVPTREEGWLWKGLRKLGWFCAALLAPHILLIIAYNQRYLATVILQRIQESDLDFPKLPPSRYRKLRRRILGCFLFGPSDSTQPDDLLPDLGAITGSDEEKALGAGHSGVTNEGSSGSRTNNVFHSGQQPGNTTPRKHPWGMQHAFYASMGGYIFDFSDCDDPAFLPCGDSRITVTPFGILFLLEHYPSHLIPDVSLEAIQDRSKSDAFGKTLVIMQVIWFCTNLIARRASNLPLGLLEISTLAHAINALLIYILCGTNRLALPCQPRS